MNFNGDTIAELKKLIIPIMSHLPVMMIVAYHTLPRRHNDQASERARTCSHLQTLANQWPEGFCFVLFFLAAKQHGRTLI